MPINQQDLDDVALTQDEYQLIIKRLGREPTIVELGIFGSLWSEHCGYQHSKPLLSIFPTTGDRVVTKVGEENAGAVDIGDGQAIVMKMESHNHPSAIEPYEGAATGVGGIVRDIFTMGARPIALLNSLRFGPLSDPRNRYLFNGVVAGIAGYGNCLGIPDVGGEIYFSDMYSGNPLVNAMCVGLLETSKLVSAQAGGAGNLLMLVGADTGRDGLHGASGLASRTFEDDRELRPTVQVGNPFLEKLLIEACLELKDTDWIVGMQDCGAAGLTSACVESVSKSGGGLEIDVAKVPRRADGMTPYEVMLSESQERMVVIVKKGNEDKVKTVFDHYDLRSDIIGHVTDDGIARIIDDGEVVAEAPIKYLTDPPLYRLDGVKPEWLDELQQFDFNSIADVRREDAGAVLLKLLAAPNIASKACVYRQYDHQVQVNTVVPPGSDAAVLRIKGTRKGIALTTDGNGRYCYLDPFAGGKIVVAEAARNLACSGAKPLALTDCLNFGNPEKPEVYWQFEQSIRGMTKACEVLGVPVISGNVSFYNETRGEAVYPTPTVGMLGLIDDIDKRCTISFKSEGDVVLLLGQGQASLAGSEYLEIMQGEVAGVPSIDIELEKRVQQCLLSATGEGLLKSAHDCSDGGLAVALAESCIAGGIGFEGELPIIDRLDTSLFGEGQSRAVVSVGSTDLSRFEQIATEQEASILKLGFTKGSSFVILEIIDLPVEELADAWQHGLEKAMG
ncbi:MAG: phosphoribosylformylglycinamidine synthase subunit PurL [Chloroflexi bacterium]|jgi:phosphoribosylformylglycinamidine synthase subunit PurL|nr:phosphoribosylformylglycinamidine synthase subunit PurL [Chloroflexota bacterium]